MKASTRVIGGVLAVVVAAGSYVQANGLPVTVTVEPRIVEATLAGVSLDRVDVSLRVALRASRAATIRSIAFTDAYVGQVPVWIEPVDGDWPLAAGQELVIPEPMQVAPARAGRSRRRRPRRHRPPGRGHGAGQRRSGDCHAVAGPAAVQGRDADGGPRRRPGHADRDGARASDPAGPYRRRYRRRRAARRRDVARHRPQPPPGPQRDGGALRGRGRQRHHPLRRRRRRHAGGPGRSAPRASGGARPCSARRAKRSSRGASTSPTPRRCSWAAPVCDRDRGGVQIGATRDHPAIDARHGRARTRPAVTGRAQAVHAGRRPAAAPPARRPRAPSRTWCVVQMADDSTRGRRQPRRGRRTAPRRLTSRPSRPADRSASSGRRSAPARDDRLRIATPLHRAVVRLAAGRRRSSGRPRRVADHCVAGRRSSMPRRPARCDCRRVAATAPGSTR